MEILAKANNIDSFSKRERQRETETERERGGRGNEGKGGKKALAPVNQSPPLFCALWCG